MPIKQALLRPVLRPLTRFLVGMLAVPLFRLLLKRAARMESLNEELEKDLEQWTRCSLVLLVATHNMEHHVFGWSDQLIEGRGFDVISLGFRLLLAVSVIEGMPDQELFAVIHPGPPKLNLRPDRTRFGRWRDHWKAVCGDRAEASPTLSGRRFHGMCGHLAVWCSYMLALIFGIARELSEKWKPVIKGVVCQHLNRSSPVFAILAAIVSGPAGWICYGMAIAQYLIIGLVTSKDKAADVLSEFDRQIAERRRELIEEYDLKDRPPDELCEDYESPCPEGAEKAGDERTSGKSTALATRSS